MNKEKNVLKEKLLSLGLPKSSVKRYVRGDWAIPDSIKILLKNKQIETCNK